MTPAGTATCANEAIEEATTVLPLSQLASCASSKC